jgi:hypothetical protein
MSARALSPLIVLSILLGPVGSAMSAGGAAPIVQAPSLSHQTPNTPIIKPTIKPTQSGPQKEAPENKPKKKPTIDPKCVGNLVAACLSNCRTVPLSDRTVAPLGAQVSSCANDCNHDTHASQCTSK